MNEIKLFLEWSRDRKFENNKLRESFDIFCKEEIEMMKDIIDMSLEYEDDGMDFQFHIFVGKLKNINRWEWVDKVFKLKSDGSIEFTFDEDREKGDYILKKCLNEKADIFLSIDLRSGKFNQSQRNDILNRIKSYSPDWNHQFHNNVIIINKK